MNKASILVIDDEQQILKLLKINLENQDYRVITAESARLGLMMAENHAPDLILLDLGLPDLDGHQVLRELKKWYQKPVIILSVINQEEDIVSALDHGATDYLTKPFRTSELLARIRAALRHNNKIAIPDCNRFGDLEVCLEARTVHRNDLPIKLTHTEFNLLGLFVRNHGRVLTHQYILREIWGLNAQNETQYLRVFVGTLRKKIENNPNEPNHIITENGVGYRFQ
jgi:two-component system KDP operon response regulator KdpE